MKNKLIVFIVLLLIPFGIWLNKTLTVIDADNYRDRMAVNEQIVGIINRLQDQLKEPQILLEQFIDLSELTEEEQRGAWGLLEMIEVDFGQEIEAAMEELSDINLEQGSDLYELQQNALRLVETYKAYSPAYQEIVEQLQTRNLSSSEIETLINSKMNEITETTAVTANAFMLAQEAMLRDN